MGKGSLVSADGSLFLRSERGTVGLAERRLPATWESRFEQPERSRELARPHPVVGRLAVLRDQDLLCYDKGLIWD